ncbi:MAG: hypothetical protein RJA76_1227 [Bacteroidota bacterium]|jgi:glycerophosphoryl diester phosphodiesterase
MKKLFVFLFFLQTAMAQQPFYQGHRGCRGFLPENTIQAFQKALELGVVLEMDVCISKDGEVVVSHEPYMNSLFCSHPDGRPVLKEEEKKLNLFEMSYSAIKQYDSGKRGNSNFPKQKAIPAFKPLLHEVLAYAESFRLSSGKPVYYNIEIKSDSTEYGISQPKEVGAFVDLVISVINSQVAWQYVSIQSFDFKVLKQLNKEKHDKGYAISALVSRKSPANVVKELGFIPEIYSSSYTSLTKEWIDESHQLGMKVIPWTVNDTKEAKKLMEWGVDGIITDYPSSLFPNPSSLIPHP